MAALEPGAISVVALAGPTAVTLRSHARNAVARWSDDHVVNLTGADASETARSIGSIGADINLVAFLSAGDLEARAALTTFIDRLVAQKRPKVDSITIWYDGSSADKVVAVAAAAIRENIPTQVVSDEIVQGILTAAGVDRDPEFTEVDLRINIESVPKAQFIPKHYILVPKELAESVLKFRVVDGKFWYWDEGGAAAYLSLIYSEAYRVLDPYYRLLQENVVRITRDARNALSPSGRADDSRMDFIALGVGSAEKERLVLQSLLDSYPSPDRFRPIHYIPVDTSFPLLQLSIRAVFSTESTAPAGLRQWIGSGGLRVTPMLTDFLNVPPEDFGANPKRLIAALGFLWNVPVPVAFDGFEQVITPESLLLVDAEFVNGRSQTDLAASYSNEEAQAFFYHPLGLLHRASQTKAAFESQPLIGPRRAETYEQHFRDYSRENGDIVPVVLGQAEGEVREFVKRMQLPAAAIHYLEQPGFLNSKTVLIMYMPHADKAQTMKPIVLGYSTRFDYNEFKNYIARHGFTTVAQYPPTENPTNAYFLLRKVTKGAQS